MPKVAASGSRCNNRSLRLFHAIPRPPLGETRSWNFLQISLLNYEGMVLYQGFVNCEPIPGDRRSFAGGNCRLAGQVNFREKEFYPPQHHCHRSYKPIRNNTGYALWFLMKEEVVPGSSGAPDVLPEIPSLDQTPLR
jgi:hypothetical protein